MGQIIDKPEGYLDHTIKNSKGQTLLLIETEDGVVTESLGDSSYNYEIEVYDASIEIREVA